MKDNEYLKLLRDLIRGKQVETKKNTKRKKFDFTFKKR